MALHSVLKLIVVHLQSLLTANEVIKSLKTYQINVDIYIERKEHKTTQKEGFMN